MGRPGMGMMGPQAAQRDPAESLRALLQLRPNQEAALQTYATALRAARQAGPMGMAAGAPATTPERLTRMEQMITRHHSAMQGLIEATRRFYAQLDPAQKRAFDEAAPMLMHRAMGKGAGMGMGMGMGCPMMGGNPP